MTGNSLGIAFIRLPSDIALKKAVEMNKIVWQDNELSIEATRKKTTVFIKNLSFSTTEASLSEVLKTFTGYVGCRVSRDASGKNRGFAHVDFDSQENSKLFTDT